METVILELKNQIAKLLETRDQVVIAIDGNCAAGKSTLTERLKEEFYCNVFHMDDFFLRSEQRTAQRYAQPGGNIDYERFQQEVLAPLKAGVPFSYRPFSCSTFTLGDAVAVEPKALNIVEGTYSQHPHFGDVYDLRIFLSVEPQQQKQRIWLRTAILAERFFTDWIPMETLYFETFRIREQSDLVLDMTR